MKKKVLGFGCWVLGAYSDYFFMIRCVRQDMGVYKKVSANLGRFSCFVVGRMGSE